MAHDDGYLFSDGDTRTYLDHARHALSQDIDQLPPDRIISTELDALVNYFVEKYTLTTPILDEARITVDQQEVQIDISGDPQRIAYFLNPGKPTYITGTRVTHYIPFTGDADLFQLRPSYYSSNFPRATIEGNELAFTHEDTRHDATSIQAAFGDTLNETKKLLGWVDNDIRPYNQSIPALARERLTTRRDKLTKDQDLVQTLGYPLRQRADAPRTYTVPTVRKKITLPPMRPAAPAEPTLDAGTYENIIGIIQSMALVLERSPAAFKDMKEEDLRTHFLVQLNAQYEGQATGETFNESGKTDILIRHDNRNLFIAECKFWNGPTSLTSAIDQLLTYASWRDTKTAILLFSKNKDFTNVLTQIPTTVNAHPNTIRQEPYASETGYRFTLHHRHDKERQLTLTVLAFNIPT
jgi:hypothetical protein